MSGIVERTAFYYVTDKGKKVMTTTIEKALERTSELGLRKLLIFTSDGEGPIFAAENKASRDIQIVAVTFPAGQVFRDDRRKEIRPKLSDPIEKKRLEDKGIVVVQGTMPLQEIVVPGCKDPRIDAIIRTLSLISLGLPLCVEAILMATDAGIVMPGEEVVSAAADTAIVGCGALSHWLFHPSQGLDIREIICKPRSRLIELQLDTKKKKEGET